MDFSETLEYLDARGNEVTSMVLGLESIRLLLHELADPAEAFPAIHIAGTNGKGSTAAMTEAILRAAGVRAGLYTSPHLLSITERIRIAGEPIPAAEFARLATRVREAAERLVATGSLAGVPTYFEQVTAIAFLWFAEQRVELAVIEVGMGGRLDATNVCRPLVTAITPVGLDHQRYLGGTVAEIAGEKAGIIKPGVPVVVAPQEEAARAVILARAEACGAPVIAGGVAAELVSHTRDLCHWVEFRTARESFDACLSLRGRHQLVNACTAIAIIGELRRAGWSIDTAAIVAGLENCYWPGRLDLRVGPEGRLILIDGAHNEAGARVLADFLREVCAGRSLTLVFGALRDKDVATIGKILFPLFARIILTGIDNSRALDPTEITVDGESVCVAGVPEALELAGRITPADGLIVVGGSLYLVAEVLDNCHKR